MAALIWGFFLMVISAACFYGLLHAADGQTVVVFLIFAALSLASGLYLSAKGLREFFLEDILAELKKISKNTGNSAICYNGKVYVLGELTAGVNKNDVWEYDIAQNSWTQKDQTGGLPLLNIVNTKK
jgi:hypothetical protein